MIIGNLLYDNAKFLKVVNEWICFITTQALHVHTLVV